VPHSSLISALFDLIKKGKENKRIKMYKNIKEEFKVNFEKQQKKYKENKI